MRQSLPQFMFGVGVVLVLVTCTTMSLSGGGSSLLTVVAETPAISNTESKDRLNRDAVFTGGATIFGLVVFGTVLSVLFMRSTEPPYDRRVVHILVGGAAVAAIASWWFMLAACCLEVDKDNLMYLMFLLLAGALLVLAGYVLIMDMIANRWNAANREDG